MICDRFQEVLSDYLVAKKQPFKNHSLANKIRNDLTFEIEKSLGPEALNLIFKGSAGQSKWADCPWAAILDPIVTESPEFGYYVVYLFASNMKKVVLSLQLGATSIRKEFGDNQGRQELNRLASFIQRRIPEYKEHFSRNNINLHAQSKSSRPAFYECAHAFGKVYSADAMNEERLVLDLKNMVALCRLLTFRGGLSISEDVDRDYNLKQVMVSEDPRRYRMHRRIERNNSAVKKVKKTLGYICQVCNFNFEKFYGVLGREFIEAHHLIPLSKLSDKGPVELNVQKDFAVLCSNCHSMIHRRNAPPDLEQFKEMVNGQYQGDHNADYKTNKE